jgi:LysM repeat protein
MKRNLSYLTLVVLTALLATATGCGAGNGDVENQETPLVAQIVPTASVTLAPQVSDTPVYTPELEPAATLTHTPEPTPTATPCVPPAGWVAYTVQPGETLYGIAQRYGMTAEELQQANCLPSADVIQPGQNLYVPYFIAPSPTPCNPPADWVLYTVQSGENLLRIALRYGMTAGELQQANCLPSADVIQAGQNIYVPYVIPPTPLPIAPPTPLPIAPPTPLPIAPPTPTPGIPDGLLEEIFYDSGGEREEPICSDPDNEGNFLQVTISGRMQDDYEMCVYGFPMNEDITVELYAPDGHFVGSQSFPVDEERVVVGGGITKTWTVARFDLWMPVGLPVGDWSAIARLANVEVQSPFSIGRFAEPAINTMPEGEINPFVPHKCASYQPGQQVIVHGTNFAPPNQNFPLGIYRLTERVDDLGRFILQLADGQIVATDSQGDFSAAIPIEADSAGDYLAILATDPDVDAFLRIEANNDCYRVP